MVILPPPMKLIAKEETGSTNDDAKLLASEGAADLTVVWALRQTRGRGRLGRQWHSNTGNLLWSVILRLDHEARRLPEVTFVTALAVRDAVASFLPASSLVEVKWPNDVLINGKKASGTLIETGVGEAWMVIGVGINLAQAPDPSQTLYNATCMAAEGATCSLDQLCSAFSQRFLSRITSWRKHGITPEVIQAYKAHMWRVGQEVSVGLDAAKTDLVTGINRTIDNDFSLRLELKDGSVVKIYAGDVMFPKPN